MMNLFHFYAFETNRQQKYASIELARIYPSSCLRQIWPQWGRRESLAGAITTAGRIALPSLAKVSFRPEQWTIDAIKADRQTWKNHKTFHPLYVRVRLYNIMFYMNRYTKGDREKAMKMLDRYIKSTHDGKMYGEWNDGGRLLD